MKWTSVVTSAVQRMRRWATGGQVRKASADRTPRSTSAPFTSPRQKLDARRLLQTEREILVHQIAKMKRNHRQRLHLIERLREVTTQLLEAGA